MSENMLHGKKVYLRSLEFEDMNRTWEWLHKMEIAEKIGVSIPFSKTQQELWFKNLEAQTNKKVFAICLVEDDKHIGNISLDSINMRHRNARFSVFIAKREIQNKGYGKDSMKILINYAFNIMNLHRIWCKTTAGDIRVNQFYKSLGFVLEGTLRQHEYHFGRYVDKNIYGLCKN